MHMTNNDHPIKKQKKVEDLLNFLISKLNKNKPKNRKIPFKHFENEINDNFFVIINFSKFQTCSICLQKIDFMETVSVLKCCHKFHSKCYQNWRVVNFRCPVCRS